jgi:hypothetical protein
MVITNAKNELNRFEVRIISVGLILSGIAIAITGVSYILNMTFTYQWLVWAVGLAFVVVGLLTIEWMRGFRKPGEVPDGKFRTILLVSIPLAFVLSSQVCGLGFRACNTACHILNIALIFLGIVVAIQLHRNKSISLILVLMIILGLFPHCVCLAPINTLWHSVFGGIAPTCEMMPLAAALFAVMALRGIRTRYSTLLIAVLYIVMIFIIVGGLLFGFPWQGCVDHPGGCTMH